MGTEMGKTKRESLAARPFYDTRSSVICILD